MMSLHLIVSGKVQGVFFRANTKRKADELGIKGYARNLENGNVEMAVQGEEEKINELIRFIKNGPGISKVENMKATKKELENFKSFEIR